MYAKVNRQRKAMNVRKNKQRTSGKIKESFKANQCNMFFDAQVMVRHSRWHLKLSKKTRFGASRRFNRGRSRRLQGYMALSL